MTREEMIIQPTEHKLIKLNDNSYAIVDNDDFDNLSKYPWCLTADGYAYNNKLGRMHRYLINCPKRLDVDHINRNRIDNRKSNLRPADRSHNNANKKPLLRSSSFKGVSWHKTANKWRSVIMFKKKQHHIGFFTEETEAAKAYDKKAIDIFGEFAYLNFK